MKKVLLLVINAKTSSNYKIRQSLITEGLQVEVSEFRQLVLILTDEQVSIYDPLQGYDVRDFDLVVFRKIGERKNIASAVAAYCRYHAIPYIDKYVGRSGGTKLASAFIRWGQGLPVPPTVYSASANNLLAVAESNYLGWPVVIKADDGNQGKNNYLVKDTDQLRDLLKRYPEIDFVTQAFIPNNGDYRILVFNHKPRMAILRRSMDGSYLNNISQGAAAEEVDITDLPEGVLKLASQTTQIDKLMIAGVDIVVDQRTGKPMILEDNPAPSLASEPFGRKILKLYAQAIKELVEL